MNRRSVRRFCVCLLLFAAMIRFLDAKSAPADGPAPPEVYTVVIRQEPEPPQTLPEPEAVQQTAPERVTFSEQEAQSIRIGGACTYEVDAGALLTRPSKLDFSQPGPKVLIVHTHSSEAYTQEAGFFYEESDELRTLDSGCSVIRIGSAVAQILNDAGIETLHDTALNDYPNYNGAYDRMKTTIEEYLEQYPSIQMVLDIHRDAAQDADGLPVALCAAVDGERCAQLMLVVGTDQGGLSHPDWEENLANALKVQALLERQAPGLCRAVDLRTERFNQHETPGSMLVEFGSTGNTLSEALRSAELFADALCTLIRGQEQGR